MVNKVSDAFVLIFKPMEHFVSKQLLPRVVGIAFPKSTKLKPVHPSKALAPTEVTPGIKADVSPLHPLNALSNTFTVLLGRVSLPSAVQPLNASALMLITLPGTTTDASAVHPLNVPFPIVLTEGERTTSVSAVHPSNTF